MILTLKTLQHEQINIEVDPSDTVKEVKSKIEASHKHEVARQKLIFAGKILADDTQIGSYNIKETDFLVLMISRAPAKPAASKPEPAPVVSQPPQPQPVQPVQPSPSQPSPVQQPSQPSQPESQSSPQSATAEESLLTGNQLDEVINNIAEMGFDKADIRAALQASFNNPERAIEYLTNGYPPGVGPNMPQARPSIPPSPSPSPSSPSVNPPQSGAPSGNLFQLAAQAAEQRQQERSSQPNAFDFLRQNPQFNALRQLIQQNPQYLGPMMQQLMESDPNIRQLIAQNQQDFIRFLQEPVSQADMLPNPPPGSIQVTPEEKEAIEQLESLGFDRSIVIQAFLACDRDATATANYLLEHGKDFEDDEDLDQSYD